MHALVPIPPSAIAEGGLWASLWAISLYSTVQHSRKCLQNATTHSTVQKVIFSCKKIFVDFCYLAQCTGFIVLWADNLSLICLGPMTKIMNCFCSALTLLINSVEASCNIYALLQIKNKKIHINQFCSTLMELISNVSFVAWGSLYTMTLFGISICPLLNIGIFFVALTASVAAIFFKKRSQDCVSQSG